MRPVKVLVWDWMLRFADTAFRSLEGCVARIMNGSDHWLDKEDIYDLRWNRTGTKKARMIDTDIDPALRYD
jgi:hypothetical protein